MVRCVKNDSWESTSKFVVILMTARFPYQVTKQEYSVSLYSFKNQTDYEISSSESLRTPAYKISVL